MTLPPKNWSTLWRQRAQETQVGVAGVEGHVVRGSLPAHLPDYTAVMYCAAAPRLDWDALCKQVDRHWKDQHPRAAGRVGGVVHSEQKH